VLGLEQFRLGHDRGASQDHSRIIRFAQHQSEYAALAPHAYGAFYEIEEESGVRVLFKTGGLVIEAPEERDPEKIGTRNVEGYVAAFEEHGFDYELLDPHELMRRWPQFRLEGSERAIFQEDSGGWSMPARRTPFTSPWRGRAARRYSKKRRSGPSDRTGKEWRSSRTGARTSSTA